MTSRSAIDFFFEFYGFKKDEEEGEVGEKVEEERVQRVDQRTEDDVIAHERRNKSLLQSSASSYVWCAVITHKCLWLEKMF